MCIFNDLREEEIVEYLYIIKVLLNKDGLDLVRLDEWAFAEYSCEGRLDYNINEETVDKILGRDAFCGGEIPDQILAKIEEANADMSEVSYYWENEVQAKTFLEFLKAKKIDCTIEKKQKEDWNESWRKSFETIHVSDQLKVVPSWEKSQDTNQNLYIYPGMGFGTGNHETTYLCLKAFEELQEYFKEGVRCLDFGCGSGILGIAAIKKKKAIVDFVDIDKDALDNCVMNLEFNEYQNYSEGHALVLRERFQLKEKYTLVFANILESVLIHEKETLLNSLSNEAFLIVSGLLADQEDTILKEYKKLSHLKTISKGDWIAMVFKNINENSL